MDVNSSWAPKTSQSFSCFFQDPSQRSALSFELDVYIGKLKSQQRLIIITNCSQIIELHRELHSASKAFSPTNVFSSFFKPLLVPKFTTSPEGYLGLDYSISSSSSKRKFELSILQKPFQWWQQIFFLNCGKCFAFLLNLSMDCLRQFLRALSVLGQ